MSSEPQEKTVESENLSQSSGLLNNVIYNPVYLLACAIILVLLFISLKKKLSKTTEKLPELPKLRKDMTLDELRKYDGTQSDGRVLVAVNGWIFDVTPARSFYGPGGPYSSFGGRDASRGLAKFSLETSDKYDDLSDLSTVHVESLKEWEAQYREKYSIVGRLLKPGEEPMSYSDDEQETSLDESDDKKLK